MIKVIQYYRIALSASVFMWHFFGLSIKLNLIDNDIFIYEMVKGEEAVIVFFIISGFLFGFRYDKIDFLKFIKKRFLRIAPIYCLASL